MVLQLDQLVYTSFPKVGFKVLTSPQVELEVKQAFLQSVVHQHWNAYNPLPVGLRAAYLHQISPKQTLFGWLYTDGIDDLGRSHIPHFLCYCLTKQLNSIRLNIIFDCLERGPIVPVEWKSASNALGKVIVPETCDYRPIHFGVTITSSLRIHNHLLLEQENLLNFFVSVIPQKSSQKSADQLEPQDLCHLAATPPSVAVSGLPLEIPEKPLNPYLETTTTPDSVLPTEILSNPLIPYSQPALSFQKRPITKMALLIGVSEYGTGFDPLPGSVKDIEAMQQVLEHPDISGFTQVKTLLNPTPQIMAEAIEAMLVDRGKDDLVLLYFSGHAIRDRRGQVCLTTTTSERGKQNKVVRSTVVSVSFLKELMDDVPTRQQVVVLDCCFSNACLQGESVLTAHSVNLDAQLAGSGRSILTAATSTQQIFAHKGQDLSIYTCHLVEGLKTGAADLNSDGTISVLEWHRYAQRRVKQMAPIMAPKIYGARAGDEIQVALSSIYDPVFKYRKQVEQCSDRGELTPVNRVVLDTLQTRLGIEAEVAAAIETEVFQPHQEYRQKLQEYSLAFVGAIQREYPISDYIFRRLKHLQAKLGLTDTDIVPVEAAMIRQVKAINGPGQEESTSVELTSPYDYRGLRTDAGRQPLRRVFTEAGSPFQTVVQTVASHLGTVSRHVSYWFNTKVAYPLATGSKTNLDFRSALIQRRFWLFLGASAFATLAVILAGRQWFYISNLEQGVERLETARILADQQQYEKCIPQVQAISDSSKLYPTAQELLKRCQAGVNWQQVRSQTLLGHPGNTVWSVALSPNGQTLVSASNDRTVKVWNLQSGKLRHTLSDHGDQVWSVAISSDGQTLASGSGDMTVKLWNLKTGELIRTLSGHTDTVWSVAISSDGQTLVSGSSDKTIRLWDLKAGKLLHTLSGHTDVVRAIAINPKGQTLASGSGDKTIKLWDLKAGKLLRTLPKQAHRVTTIAFSPDGQTLAGSDNTAIKLWNLDTGKLLRTLSGHTAQVTAIAFSPTGKTLASSSQDKTVRLWNLQQDDPFRTFSGHLDPVYSVVFGPDRGTLASGTKDGTIRVWQRN